MFYLCAFLAVGVNRERFVLSTILIFVCVVVAGANREVCAADSFDLCVFVGGGVKRERAWLPTMLIFVCANMLLLM